MWLDQILLALLCGVRHNLVTGLRMRVQKQLRPESGKLFGALDHNRNGRLGSANWLVLALASIIFRLVLTAKHI
jgi:hypothetical protein